jgi:ABC-2 type transport system permease protein
MLKTIAMFELRNGLRRISTYVYFSLFLVLGYLLLITAGGAFPSANMGLGTGGKVVINSPYLLFAFISSLSFYGLLVIAAVMGYSGQQDFQHNTYPLLFTEPISKNQYLAGRFIASNILLLFIFSSIGLGSFLGSCMPFLDNQLVGSNHVMAYLQPYFLSVIPNTLVIGAIFFGMAALSRKMLPVYVSAVLIFVGYLIAATISADMESKYLAGLIDPFGNFAFEHVTQYWTVAEKNTDTVPLAGLLLINRVLWLTLGAGIFGFTLYRFRFAQGGEDTRRAKVTETDSAQASDVSLLRTAVQFRNPIHLLPRLTWLEFHRTISSVGFLLIVISGVAFIFISTRFIETRFGTSVYPVTSTMVELARGTFHIFLLIIIIVYSGQMVWRERDESMHQLCDVLPTPTWLPFVSKILALMLVQAFLFGVIMFSGISVQATQGFYEFQPALYVQDLFGIQLISVCLVSVLAVTVQVVVNHKYLGHFVMVLYYIVNAFLSNFGFEHHLYRYASTPGYTYSDMNGFGHFIGPIVWFDLYWTAFAVLLAIIANLLWVRGLEVEWRRRLQLAWARFTRPLQVLSVGAMIAWISLGGFIFYNTNVLNEYRTQHGNRLRQVRYEKQYKEYEQSPQPRIQSVNVNIDIYPEDLRLHAQGAYQLKNKTSKPISLVFVNLPLQVEIHQLSVGPARQASQEDERSGVYIFDLPQPLEPGQSLALDFDLDYATQGFTNQRGSTRVVHNGTFFNNANLPRVGYVAGAELSEDSVRRKYGLQPKDRMASIDNMAARRNHYISTDADWIDFEATVSTAPDQIAVAPGSLQREWTEDGRRYFNYKSDGQILCFYSFLSARYEVLRDRWNNVAIEIYYQKGHEYNLDSMVTAIKTSLDYFTKHFSPYQHKQIRILEFPRYQQFAQSFPNTIPYSESLGFIARVDPDDEKDINYPVYVTAHEVAHQWWAHQVIGGNVQGATMLSETMAQYSALMVMKQTFGADKMKRFLRYELDRYLMGRGTERKKEMPLALVENQPYIHYNKGSLVMYALQDYIGESTVNQALSNYIKDVGFQEPPYTVSRELIKHFRRATPSELKGIIEDLFETITLFDNHTVATTYKQRDDGKFDVRIKVASRKFRADELGVEIVVPIDDQIDIGVLDKDGNYLYLEKHKIDTSESEIIVQVDVRPAKAGIDPLNILVDRKPKDNVISVKAG